MALPPDQSDRQQVVRFLSPQEFSQLSGLSLATVHRYLKNGKLLYRQPAGRRGRVLIPSNALATLACTTSQPMPADAAATSVPDFLSTVNLKAAVAATAGRPMYRASLCPAGGFIGDSSCLR
jgi:hypothetical protein